MFVRSGTRHRACSIKTRQNSDMTEREDNSLREIFELEGRTTDASSVSWDTES